MKTRDAHSIPILCVLYILSIGAHAKKKNKAREGTAFFSFFFQMK